MAVDLLSNELSGLCTEGTNDGRYSAPGDRSQGVQTGRPGRHDPLHTTLLLISTCTCLGDFVFPEA